MPALGNPPPVFIKWYFIPFLLALYPPLMLHDWYMIRKHQRTTCTST